MHIPISTKFQSIQLSLLLACGIATGAHAQGLLTDQSLQAPTNTGGIYHYEALGKSLVPATGQEFTPSLQGLDFVDVNLFNSRATNTGTFEIAIHAGNITAPVLGLSAQVARLEGFPQSNTHFTFSSTVPLIAGDLYVLEVIQLSGDSGWAIEVPTSAVVHGQTIDMNYPGGRLIYAGVPQENQDMIFREGIVVTPEPHMTTLCLLGVLTLGFSRKLTADRA
jgi:hypothetical protein